MHSWRFRQWLFYMIGGLLATAASLPAYDFRLIPSDALVRRTKEKSKMTFVLLVRRDPGEPAYEAPAQLQVRLTSGEDVVTVPLLRQDAVGPSAPDSRYQEIQYSAELPDPFLCPTPVDCAHTHA